MFTGIVEGLGNITEIIDYAKEFRLKIYPEFEIKNYKKGESIAINGVCLTVESFGDDFFNIYASEETLKKTNLSKIKTNSKVNLERAVKMGDRLGGHLVTGHIDGIAVIQNITKEGSSIKYSLTTTDELKHFIVNKGSICLDGISLTVNDCHEKNFEVNIIPETQKVTIVKSWRIGDMVNIETDIIGKYIYKNLNFNINTKRTDISLEFLKQNGYIE